MSKLNILHKEGMLSSEDRKKPLVRGMGSFTFETCIDLSQGVKVTPYGTRKEFSINEYSNDVAAFISFWNSFVLNDLNGFSGFGNVKFYLPEGVKLIDTSKDEPENQSHMDLVEFENILDKHAKKHMISWGIEGFKRTHKRLMRTFIESMKEVKDKYK